MPKRAKPPQRLPTTPEWPAANVEMWPLARVKPYERNPRTHSDEQINLIAASMREDGVIAPIMVDEKDEILYGHGRRLAALKCGFETYPVIVARGYSEAQKKAIRIKDNQLALLAEWDSELMKLELGDLRLADYELGRLGLPELDLTNFIAGGGEYEELDREVELPTADEIYTAAGDIWHLGRHRLVCGDCTNQAVVASLLAGDKPRLMVTDPPYGVNYDPGWRSSLDSIYRATNAINNDHQSNWIKAWNLFAGNVIYCWYASLDLTVPTSLQQAGFVARSQIIWAKPAFAISRGDYHWQHETCLYCVRKNKSADWNGDRTQATIWEIDNNTFQRHAKQLDDMRTKHGSQKPIQCMARPMRNNSRIGEYVYDPFLGSGTSIIAAETLDRRCLGIEINPAYVQVAIERWEKMTGKAATLDGKTTEQVRETRNTRIAVPGRNAGTAKKKPKVRRAGDARQSSKGRVAIRQPPAMAGDSR